MRRRRIPLSGTGTAPITIPPQAAARSKHLQGVNVAMADGSVRYVLNGVNQAIWRGLGTKNGGEVVTEP